MAGGIVIARATEDTDEDNRTFAAVDPWLASWSVDVYLAGRHT
jgi:hypothetical protein